ncbi:uncharacterized protein K460DRAFT_109996 [Cucurbitaria berberidis CBS 394.84]|uniref:MARVEL domain-containing protein n=1 Tax=Cucurbitaria berberidis CBS 394.84 TaxID=1168544 RepID=A0A9P4L8Q0_9PLEO|nr:uncharacterized protein K460DRAFT_109996 [Cucurbitaria berberidis CBS 394.84]KAF1845498.1 hypothetical protein K460DRAFT_109996 [Cucurbitaria berberidis CBS 394.84]
MAQQPVLWQKRVLVPFWTVRIFIMIIIIATYAWVLQSVNNIKDVAKPAIASVVVFMLFIIIVLLMDILAIVLFLRDALKPGNFLIMNCIQTGFWAVVLIINFVAIGRGKSSVGIGFSIFIFLTFVGLLIYSIIGYTRAKKAAQLGQYAPAHNPAAPAPATYPAPYPTQYQNANPYQQTTAYSHTPEPVELQAGHLPPYQAGAAGDYYSQQPQKPANVM